jgi:putative ABC transport system substrate-binding protein
MRRRALALITAVLISAPVAAHAQQQERLRLGILAGQLSPAMETFLAGLRELGWVDGRNIAIHMRLSNDRNELLPALAEDLVRLEPHAIMAPAAIYVDAAREATRSIPIVFCVHADPVGSGTVTSLARPGGNITGMSVPFSGLLAKQLEMIRDLVPGIARVAVLLNPTDTAIARFIPEAHAAGDQLGLELLSSEVSRPEDLAPAFAAMTRAGARAVVAVRTPFFYHQHARIAELAMEHKLPSMASYSEFVYAGGLAAYAPNMREVFRRCPIYVDRILRGAKPAELAIEEASKYDLVLNRKTAARLGLPVPQALLLRADEVIE